MTIKTPTSSSISRLLASAGFEKSVSRKSGIKGWPEWSAGYKVSKGYGDGEVFVEHRVSSLRIRSASWRDEVTAMLGEYSDVIGARYAVAKERDRLVIAAKKADQ